MTCYVIEKPENFLKKKFKNFARAFGALTFECALGVLSAGCPSLNFGQDPPLETGFETLRIQFSCKGVIGVEINYKVQANHCGVPIAHVAVANVGYKC